MHMMRQDDVHMTNKTTPSHTAVQVDASRGVGGSRCGVGMGGCSAVRAVDALPGAWWPPPQPSYRPGAVFRAQDPT